MSSNFVWIREYETYLLIVLVMFCVLKFCFVDFYGMFTSSPTWRLKMHVLCKVGKSIIFQNKTLLVMFYRHNKIFWYQFCDFKHFLKAENSKDSLASSYVKFSVGLSCNPVWNWVTIGTRARVKVKATVLLTCTLTSQRVVHHASGSRTAVWLVTTAP